MAFIHSVREVSGRGKGVGNCLADLLFHGELLHLPPSFLFYGYTFDGATDSLDYLTLIEKITIGRLLTREM